MNNSWGNYVIDWQSVLEWAKQYSNLTSLIWWKSDVIIIIISPLQSTAGHRPLQLLANSLDLRLLASSSRQPSIVFPPGLRVFYTTFTETSSLQNSFNPAVAGSTADMGSPPPLIRCAMSVTLVLCRITLFRIRSRRETPSIALSIFRWATLSLWTSRAEKWRISK
jgi:hypothetical protein